MSRAAYMREYRARKREAIDVIVAVAEDDASEALTLRAENARLVEEVARLKRELAARPASMTVAGLTPAPGKGRPMTIAFNPAPKPGRK